MKVRKKRAITLLEIMIVIFLIGLIGSVVGYNMKGSLDKGKVFKTQMAQKQVKDILLLQVAQGEDPNQVILDPHHYLEASGLVTKDQADNLLKDGWNQPFEFKVTKDNDIEVISPTLDKKKGKSNNSVQQNNVNAFK